MELIPRIELLPEKKLIGKRMIMSLANDKTGELWRSFMPLRKEIQGRTGTELYSLQVYGPGYFNNFDPNTNFEKWAAMEVSDLEHVPEGMEVFILKGGLYAVFHYKGLNTDHSIFQFIFSKWLPGSEYMMDDRPHFEFLGEKYRNNDPDSEEEIWIPVNHKE